MYAWWFPVSVWWHLRQRGWLISLWKSPECFCDSEVGWECHTPYEGRQEQQNIDEPQVNKK